jgi:SAM-dependent methyltransferase
VSSFHDHFSGHAGRYAQYRPDYPAELFAYLASLTPRHEVALDCATGSGQAAVGLAAHFERVIATDGSIAQLRSARAHPNVVYVGNLAEQPALREASVDLVAAAQAAHWFDHSRFHSETRRVLRPHGALAIWTYGLALIEPAIDAAVRRFYDGVVGPYWPPERRHVESAYRALPFPWRDVAAPPFELRLEWNLESLMGYIGTWSAVQRYVKATGKDPLPELRAELVTHWNSPATPRSVIWPLHLRVGRHN